MSQSRWQPVVMVLDDRLECECGNLAVFINGKVVHEKDDWNCLSDVGAYCQSCWQKERLQLEQEWDK